MADKVGTQRRFDLTERVLPPEALVPVERSEADFADWYTRRRVACVGLLWNRRGGAWQGYVFSRDAARKAALERLCAREELIPCRVEGRAETFYALPEALEMAEHTPSRRAARFIAPLDNLMWDRDMVEALFGFKYRWEVYTPVAQRQYGYYVLPVLYGDRFVARFDPQPVSKAGCFRLNRWHWEPGARVSRAMLDAIEAAMLRFAAYLSVDCDPKNMDIVRNGL